MIDQHLGAAWYNLVGLGSPMGSFLCMLVQSRPFSGPSLGFLGLLDVIWQALGSHGGTVPPWIPFRHGGMMPWCHCSWTMMPWCHGGMMPWWHHTTVYFQWVLGKSGNQCFPDFARIHFHWRLPAFSAEPNLQVESRHVTFLIGGMGAPWFFFYTWVSVACLTGGMDPGLFCLSHRERQCFHHDH